MNILIEAVLFRILTQNTNENKNKNKNKNKISPILVTEILANNIR